VIDVTLAYEDTDVKVKLPAVPRVGDIIHRDDGSAPEFRVSAVHWYWDMTDPDDVTIYVLLDEKNAG
jgi:hypothetical protein